MIIIILSDLLKNKQANKQANKTKPQENKLATRSGVIYSIAKILGNLQGIKAPILDNKRGLCLFSVFITNF